MNKPIDTTEVVATLQQAVDAMRACTDNSYILAWDNGMGVAFTADFKPYACGLHMAEVVANDDMPEDAWAFTPIVLNGHGAQAQVQRRQPVLQAEIAKLEKFIAEFRA